MEIDQAELTRRMDHFAEACRASGAKLTHQRIEIYRELAGITDHPDAETIHQRVRQRMPTVSLDTVYRTLWWLKDLGLAKTLGPTRERARFDANLSNHHHFVCTQCGLTSDFLSKELDRLTLPASMQAIGYAETTQVEVKGVCRQCATQPKS